jgi:NADPH-dependent curcumin reductase CurA
MPTNTQILLDHRPTDKVSPANFRIVETPVPTPGPGEVLVRTPFCRSTPICAVGSATRNPTPSRRRSVR